MGRLGRKIKTLVLLPVLYSCVERIEFLSDRAIGEDLIVDGFISNLPETYTIRLFKSRGQYDLRQTVPVTHAKVKITDNHGKEEILAESSEMPGVYLANISGEFQGVIGNTYTLNIIDPLGEEFTSQPQRIEEPGFIDTVYYNFETFKPIKGPTEYGLRLYLDARISPESQPYVRWKYGSTYKITTNPELREAKDEHGNIHLDPPLCYYGYEIVDFVSPIRYLTDDGSCGCCTCWVSIQEDYPHVSSNKFISNGVFKGIEIAYIPINGRIFQNKLKVEIQQMSLSKEAYEFWQVAQAHALSAGSLFNPPGGVLKSNLYHKNGQRAIQGLFYASGIHPVSFYITPSDVRKFTTIPPPEIFKNDCRKFDFSTTEKPQDWVD